ncbi:hypothetical protein LXA43DRAFT_1072063 [Ganoderma leucocontextum]|nr:hypothetical protein LXA43DRAFT_1072063 [Ganoderma leucocontextum]
MIEKARTIYGSLEYVVRFNGETTDTFRVLAGILIGDPASPVLWILIISDFHPHPHKDDVFLGGIRISHLWLADDGILVCLSAAGVQSNLSDFDRFRSRRFLNVSVPKTAASIFGELPPALPPLELNGGRVNYVSTYVYTGTAFSTTTRDMFADHYARRAASAEKIAHASFSLQAYTGTLPPQVALTLYRARVEPHLTFGCEVALDVHAPSYERLEKVQNVFLRRALGLGGHSQLIPLFSETGVKPIRYRRLELALRFAQYALQPNAPAYVAAALHEAHALATAGHPSWWSDLYRALAALPVPVALPIHADLTPHLLADIARSLDSSLAAHIHASVVSSHRLPILAARFAFLPSQPPVLQALCKWRAYLNVPFAPHREALVRLLVSDHKLAVEALRRVSPQVPRHRRICRLCEVRSAIESELHVLLECRNEQLCAIRDAFYARILPRLPKLPRLVDSTPPLILPDDNALLDLQA